VHCKFAPGQSRLRMLAGPSMAPSAAPATDQGCEPHRSQDHIARAPTDLLHDLLEAVPQIQPRYWCRPTNRPISRVRRGLSSRCRGSHRPWHPLSRPSAMAVFADASLADPHGVVFGCADPGSECPINLVVASPPRGLSLPSASQLGEVFCCRIHRGLEFWSSPCCR